MTEQETKEAVAALAHQGGQPEAMVPVMLKAMHLCQHNGADVEMTLPHGVSFRLGKTAKAWQIVDHFELTQFMGPEWQEVFNDQR
jgi:hypothetical protein